MVIKKETIVNLQAGTTTMKTVVPAFIRDFLELEHKDVLVWELDASHRVTIRKK